jgi:carbamoyl-phosphate synthase small subunit
MVMTKKSGPQNKKYTEARGEQGVLALADGTVFYGRAFGALRGQDEPITGEAVFNTSMYGYQEILTDPSYAGQIMCFTYPHIGNVGCNEEDVESGRVYTEGLIVRRACKVPSNFRSTQSLSAYLAQSGVMGLEGIDTRQLVAHLRDKGAQMAVMAAGEGIDPAALVAKAKSLGTMEGKDYVREVACAASYTWDHPSWTLTDGNSRRLTQEQLVSRPHVVAIDCGIKTNILRLLVDVGFRVTVVPAGTTSSAILALKPDGVFLSNGPGDPATLGYVVDPVRELLGKLPLFGICLGHQILGQALGGKTYKLKFGHRGGNHPVRDETTGKVEISVQNHGFAVAKDSLPKNVFVSHINLNDGTVEGLEVKDLRAFSVQYHPEASPGPHDSRYLFQRFFDLVVGADQIKHKGAA